MTSTIQYAPRIGGDVTLPIRYARDRIGRNTRIKIVDDKGAVLFDGKMKRSPIARNPIPLVEHAK